MELVRKAGRSESTRTVLLAGRTGPKAIGRDGATGWLVSVAQTTHRGSVRLEFRVVVQTKCCVSTIEKDTTVVGDPICGVMS